MNKRDRPFAKRSLGQNFLIDTACVSRIVAAVDAKAGDTIIEIGPGRGALTERLVESEARVIAVEIDRDLVPELRARFADWTNFEVIEADFLEVGVFDLLAAKDPSKVKIVGNLPYYISTPIIQKLIDSRSRFSSAVLMLQKEVVDRLTAKPGSSERGYITVLSENAFEIKKLFEVPPASFRPAPKVHSAVARMTPQPQTIADSSAFRKLISRAFAQKRKTICNNLKDTFPNAAELLANAEIDGGRRAETLTLSEWGSLLHEIDQSKRAET
jgi:16S rRNA (adenine1518-N6/adenine1519-N6)-dimethyltransferase